MLLGSLENDTKYIMRCQHFPHKKFERTKKKRKIGKLQNQLIIWQTCVEAAHVLEHLLQGPEWTNTHQCNDLDGWCTDRILFSIPVPSQVDFFSPFLSPDLSFFCNFIFSPPPSQFFFSRSKFFFGTLFSPHPSPSFFFLLLKLFPPTHLQPPTDPLWPTRLYI